MCNFFRRDVIQPPCLQRQLRVKSHLQKLGLDASQCMQTVGRQQLPSIKIMKSTFSAVLQDQEACGVWAAQVQGLLHGRRVPV